MKRLAAAVLAATVALGVTGCDNDLHNVETPSKAAEQSFSECSREQMERLKKEEGVQYLIDFPEQANARVLKLCKALTEK